MSVIYPFAGWVAVMALAAAAVHGIRHGRRTHDYAGYAIACLYSGAAVILLPFLGAVHTAVAVVIAVLLGVTTAGIAASVSGLRGAPATLAGYAGTAVTFLAADARALPHRIRARLADDEPAPPVIPPPTAHVPPAAPFTPAPGSAPGAVRRPAIRAKRAAAVAASATPGVPAEWGGVVALTTDFRAESNVEFAGWLTGQVMGTFAWAEAMVEQHEASRDELGVDPAAIAALGDVAAAIVACGETAAGAVHRFCAYFELPDAFVDNGGKLANAGDWHQGSPSL
jgi:hypothetical protein